MDYPKTFKDDLGRPWTVDITVAALKRAKLLANFDIESLIAVPEVKPKMSLEERAKLAIATLTPIQEFLDDTTRFSDVLYAIIRPQAVDAGISQEAFDDGFRGGCSEESRLAFMQALHDFFHRDSPKRQIVRGVMEARKRVATLEARTLTRRMMETEKAIAGMDRELEKAMTMANEFLDEPSSKSVADSPDKSELTQTTAP